LGLWPSPPCRRPERTPWRPAATCPSGRSTGRRCWGRRRPRHRCAAGPTRDLQPDADSGRNRALDPGRRDDNLRDGVMQRFSCAAGIRIGAGHPDPADPAAPDRLDVRTVARRRRTSTTAPPGDRNTKPVCVPRADWMKTNASYPPAMRRSAGRGRCAQRAAADRANALAQSGRDFAQSRVICGVPLPERRRRRPASSGRPCSPANTPNRPSSPTLRRRAPRCGRAAKGPPEGARPTRTNSSPASGEVPAMSAQRTAGDGEVWT